jgi:hypothetical protein
VTVTAVNRWMIALRPIEPKRKIVVAFAVSGDAPPKKFAPPICPVWTKARMTPKFPGFG